MKKLCTGSRICLFVASNKELAWFLVHFLFFCHIQGILISSLRPEVISRSEHGISRANISEYALKVLYRLSEAGYDAYLVGGAVRDLLLGCNPKDWDVATNATPEEIRQLFRNCRLIGRRFRLAHIYYGREIIEVATFRAAHGEAHRGHAQQLGDGRILRDNAYGSIDSDVMRRDLTCNSLFYDIKNFSIVDYVGGVADINARRICVIGDSETRYREDPVRMLRALRFTAKLSFHLTVEAAQPISHLAPMLDDIPAARLFDETLKLFQKGHALRSFEVLREYGLFSYLFLQTEDTLSVDSDHYVESFIRAGLENTDNRINSGKFVNPAFLYALLLWGSLRQAMYDEVEGDMDNIAVMNTLSQDIFQIQSEQTAIPKRFSVQAREIWALQPRFGQRQGKRPLRLLSHPRFRAAYDFLLLRNQAGENLHELCEWWTEFQKREASRMREIQANHINYRSHTRFRKPRRQTLG